MDIFLQPEQKGGVNKTLLVALAIAAILVVLGILIISQTRTSNQIKEEAIDDAFREGQPEFALYTKKIIIQTDQERTTESPTGIGTIVMSINGIIRNITGKTLTALEIKVTVIDMAGKPIKDKTVIVVPKQADKLENGASLPVKVLIEGFDKDDDRAQIRWKVTAIKVQE